MLSKGKTAFPKAHVIFPKRVLTSVLKNKIYAIARLLARRWSEKYRDRAPPCQKAVHTERNGLAACSQLCNLWGLSTYIDLHYCWAIVPNLLFMTTMCLCK